VPQTKSVYFIYSPSHENKMQYFFHTSENKNNK